MDNIYQMISDTLFMIQNTLYVYHMASKHTLFYGIYGDSWTTRLENMILGQLKIGERQAICRGLVSGHAVSQHIL